MGLPEQDASRFQAIGDSRAQGFEAPASSRTDFSAGSRWPSETILASSRSCVTCPGGAGSTRTSVSASVSTRLAGARSASTVLPSAHRKAQRSITRSGAPVSLPKVRRSTVSATVIMGPTQVAIPRIPRRQSVAWHRSRWRAGCRSGARRPLFLGGDFVTAVARALRMQQAKPAEFWIAANAGSEIAAGTIDDAGQSDAPARIGQGTTSGGHPRPRLRHSRISARMSTIAVA